MKVKMRVGIITYDFYPFEGGQGRRIFEIYKRLRNNSEFEIIIFSPSHNYLENSVEVFRLTKKFGKNISFSFLANLYIKRWIQKYGLDIVHLHGGPGGIFMFRKLNVPIIYTAHHTYHQQYSLVPGQGWKWILSKLEQISYGRTHEIISVSNNTKDILTAKYRINKGRIKVIPNGVNTEKFTLLKNVKKIRDGMLFVGRLDERKGIQFLIESMPHIREKIRRIKLFVIGTGKLRRSLGKLIKHYNLEPNVEFLGFVPDDKLVEWYNRAEVVIVPSLFEGFGITLVESLACGTPVIGTKVPGIVDVIKNGETGVLVTPKDAGELANEVVHLLQNKRLREDLGRTGRKEILEKFDWDTISENVNRFYRKIAEVYS